MAELRASSRVVVFAPTASATTTIVSQRAACVMTAKQSDTSGASHVITHDIQKSLIFQKFSYVLTCRLSSWSSLKTCYV
jgi:hypothetical protein